MKKTLLTIVILFSFSFTYGQKELWGVNKGIDDGNPNSIGYKGNITKYDINGENPIIIHEFLDFSTGKTPKGKLFLSSNGKLYGVTIAGGNTVGGLIANGNGVLYEYDLILDKYRVVHYFDVQAPNGIHGVGVIEPNEGKLYGSVSNKVYCYDLETEVFTYLTGTAGYSIDGELVKASNGFLYCTTRDSYCPGVNIIGPNNYGTIIKVNTINNSIQQVYQLQCDGSEGVRFSGEFIETTSGKLFNITEAGGNSLPGNGTIFEFDINTNIFTRKVDFDGDNLGISPMGMVSGDNGSLYGVCSYGGINYVTLNGITYTQHQGTLFEYAPSTNSINKLYDFPNGEMTYSVHPTSIMKSSTGYFFGTSPGGFYRFNPVDNTTMTPCYPCTTPPTIPNANVTETLIEICRKPSYHEFDIDTFNPCVNTPFTFDVQNTNATLYTWKKDGEIVPMQTTGVLNMPNVTVTDSGDYTCEMVNECGTTVTMALHVNVGCLGIDEMAAYNKLISLCPNPAKEFLNIKLPENSNLTITGCTISNMLGQVVFKNNGDNPQINTANYATGLYSLVLKTDKGNWFGKFIKE